MNIERAGNRARLAVSPAVAKNAPCQRPLPVAKSPNVPVVAPPLNEALPAVRSILFSAMLPIIEPRAGHRVLETRQRPMDAEMVVNGNLVPSEVSRQRGRRGEFAGSSAAYRPAREIRRRIPARRDTVICCTAAKTTGCGPVAHREQIRAARESREPITVVRIGRLTQPPPEIQMIPARQIDRRHVRRIGRERPGGLAGDW